VQLVSPNNTPSNNKRFIPLFLQGAENRNWRLLCKFAWTGPSDSYQYFHLHVVERFDLLPSIASFFFLQSEQRYGPPHGVDGAEQQPPTLSVIKPSNGSWSTWQIAQRNGGRFAFDGKFLPNLRKAYNTS